MRSLFPSLAFILFTVTSFSQTSGRKVYTQTPEYKEVIHQFSLLDSASSDGKLFKIGTADGGESLYMYVLLKGGCSNLFVAQQQAQKMPVLFINNAIHPGEPDGVDASLELVRTLQQPGMLPDNLLLAIIPVFNVDGSLNRSGTSRANQNGPEEYGFRGNSLNLDLNRDFIKTDAQVTQALQRAFQLLKPDVFVDTHVSNGADYQHTMTLIATQKDKQHPLPAKLMNDTLVPQLYKIMQQKGWPMSPYVDTRGETPESGIAGFLETPRFSTGYAALFNCIGFVTETHMWKPYNDRVWATYDILISFVDLMKQHGTAIRRAHKAADTQVCMQQNFALSWVLDTTKAEQIQFMGYEAKYKTSNITGQQRLYYDRNAPYTKTLPYYNTYTAATNVQKPYAYIVPQQYKEVIARLSLNGVKMQTLLRDTVLTVETYYIASYQTAKAPYESHYLHHSTKLRREMQQIEVRAGDVLVVADQVCNRYIVETLEPEGGDSFFAWNFFDGILQQKEGFSDYIFEEKAEEILAANPQLKAELEAERARDAKFAADHWAQLNFIYQRSVYKEKTHNRYPVMRILQPVQLQAKPYSAQ
jgi:Zinc carboxypeptidase